MNCKPGDLAVIVDVAHGCDAKLIGSICQTVSVEAGCDGSPAWKFIPVSPRLAPESFRSIYDRNLRPIRDPGEDARDETLAWKHVPSEAHNAPQLTHRETV